MRAASNGHGSSVSAARRPVTATARVAPFGAALGELQRLVRTLERRVAAAGVDVDVDLDLLGGTVAMTHAEGRLRAVTALLVNLSTYQGLRTRPSPAAAGGGLVDHGSASEPRTAATAARPPGQHGVAATPAGLDGAAMHDGITDTASRVADADGAMNGRTDTTSDGDRHGAVGSERELAAATACYIARDLAARQLSEFTSAEGYRLARTLARLGGVEHAVERLLAQANDVRLHPAPLSNAVSHSQR